MGKIDITNQYNQEWPDEWRMKVRDQAIGGAPPYDMSEGCYCGLGIESAMSNISYMDLRRMREEKITNPDAPGTTDFTTSYNVSDFTFSIGKLPADSGNIVDAGRNAFIGNVPGLNSTVYNVIPSFQRVSPTPIRPDQNANGLYDGWSLNWAPINLFMFRDLIATICVDATSNLDNTNSTTYTLQDYLANRTVSHPYITAVYMRFWMNVPTSHTGDDPKDYDSWTPRWIPWPNLGTPWSTIYSPGSGGSGNQKCAIVPLNATGIENNSINYSFSSMALGNTGASTNVLKVEGMLGAVSNLRQIYLSGGSGNRAELGQAYVPFAMTNKWKIIARADPTWLNDRIKIRAYREYDDTFEEEAMSQVACYGLFFMKRNPDGNQTLEGDEVYLGILEDGVGHGRYTNDEEEKKDALQWSSRSDGTGYTPGGGGGVHPTPDPSTKPIYPQQPGFSLAVGNGSVCYTISKADWRQIWDDIYGGSQADWKSLIDGLSLYGANPLNCILNYRWYPFSLSGSGQAPIRLGSTIVKPVEHKYHYIASGTEAFKSSQATFWLGKEKNFVNSRKTKCRVWLPFYGYYELPMSLMLVQELEIQFQYSLPDDTGVWVISFNNVIYDFVECQPYIEIPITGDNSLQIAAAKAQRNLAIAGTVAAAVGGIAMGAMAAGPGLAAIGSAASDAAWAYGGSKLAASAAVVGPLIQENLLGLGTAMGAMGAGGAALGGVSKTANTVMQSALQVGTLSTNVPVHSAASDTTFLNLPFIPYVELYWNKMQETYNEAGYKKSTGIACNVWTTIDKMDNGSFLQINNPILSSYSGMDEQEIAAMHQALAAGFYK